MQKAQIIQSPSNSIELLKRYSFVYIYIILYSLSAAFVYTIDKTLPRYFALYWGINVALIAAVLYFTRKRKVRIKLQTEAKAPFIFSVVYVVFYILITTVFWNSFFGKSRFNYQLTALWLLLVIVPGFLIKRFNGKRPTLGFKRDLKKNLITGTIISLFMSPILIIVSPLGQKIVSGDVSIKLLPAFPLILVFAFLTAAFQEEYFFRGILQESAQGFFKSEINAITFTMIFFSFYHLPFILFEPQIIGKGLLYGIALTFIMKGTSAIGFGIIWYRTRNILAPAFVHAWMNALPNINNFKM